MSKKNEVKCIFCGEKPKNQNKEHVIPKWLLKLTGDEHRKAYFGMNKDSDGLKLPIVDIDSALSRKLPKPHRVYSFSSFTFPACKSCNDEFAILESDVQKIVTRLVKDNSLENGNIPNLLDWLDKVRVGLWLGNRLLDKNFFDVDPNFAIKQRMGMHDRVLMIRRIKGLPEGINFLGTDTYAFSTAPSVFCLRINDYFLFNLSSVLFISKELGFPYFEKAILDNKSDKIEVEILKGTEKTSQPLPMIDTDEINYKFYQPIILSAKGGLKTEDYDLVYNTEYIKSNCLDIGFGQGKVFIDNDGVRALHEEECITFTECNSIPPLLSLEIATIDVLKFQSWLIYNHHSKLDLSLLNEEQVKIVNKHKDVAIHNNESYIKSLGQSILNQAMRNSKEQYSFRE